MLDYCTRMCYIYNESERKSVLKKEQSQFRIGEIYMMKFTGDYNEQDGWRPGLVFQNNKGNKHSPNIIALPLTSSIKSMHLVTHVLLRAENTGLHRDSVVICENPESMSKNKIGRYITTISDNDMSRIAEASMLATSAIAFVDINSLVSIWEKAKMLNSSCKK